MTDAGDPEAGRPLGELLRARASEIPASLGERYQVLRQVGSGAAGTVLLAHDRQLDRQVAIKLLHRRGPDEQHLERFAREVALMVEHPHPYLVPVLDADVACDQPYLVSHWMPGGSLHQRIRAGVAGTPEIARVGERLARALHHLHLQGVLHRDVKPANALLDDRGEAYLADLGLGRADDMSALTETGYLVGTPRYMAPELLETGQYSPASDQFALGISLIEMARRPTKLPEFLGTNIIQELLAGIGDRDLRQVLRQAVRTDPRERWRDLAALGDALAVLAGEERATDVAVPRRASEDATASRVLPSAAPAPSPTPPLAGRPSGPTTGPHPREAAGRAGRLGVAFGVVVSTVLAGWLTTESPPPPPTPPPPTEDAAAAIARDAPGEALERLLAGHRYPDGAVRPALNGSDYVTHEARVVEDMLDARFTIRWRRLLEGLDAWAMKAGFEPAPRAALDAAVRTFVDPVHHLACDQMIARLFLFRVSTPLVHGVSRPPEGAAAGLDRDRLASLQDRVREVRTMVRDALKENALLRAPPGPWSEVLRLRLQGLVADERLNEAVARARELAAAATDPVVKGNLLAAGLTSMPTTLHEDTLPCELVLPIFRDAYAFTRDPPPGLPAALRLELAGDLVLQWFSNGSKCLPRAERNEPLRRAMAWNQELMAADPSLPLQVLTFAAHQQTTTALVGRGIDPALEGEMDLMAKILDEARAAVTGGG